MAGRPDLLALAVAVGHENAYAGTVVAAGVHDGDTVHVSVVDPLLAVPAPLSVRLAGRPATRWPGCYRRGRW